MLHTEYKLSEVLTNENAFKNAVRIVARHCLDGAIDNQHNNDEPATYEALSDWGFQEIMDLYLENAFISLNDEPARIVEPVEQSMMWHDELILDIDEESEAWLDVREAAYDKLQDLAQELEEK